MRHAFDADHIAAIDNTTRKLMADGKRPMSVGFWFSLGHSTIVFVLAFVFAIGIKALNGPVSHSRSQLHAVTNWIGTGVSGVFLYLIAALNIVILLGILRVFREMRSGRYDEAELEAQLEQPRADEPRLRPLHQDDQQAVADVSRRDAVRSRVRHRDRGRPALPRRRCSRRRTPFYAILCLPILFAAGMSLLDTIDGTFMNFAYGWAFSKPVRKVFYNLTITGLSVAVALVIGTIELGGIIASHLNAQGSVLGRSREHQHQHARLHHRRHVRRHVAGRAGGMALRHGSRSAGTHTSRPPAERIRDDDRATNATPPVRDDR